MGFRRFVPQLTLAAATAVLLTACTTTATAPDITSEKTSQSIVVAPTEKVVEAPASESQRSPTTDTIPAPVPATDAELETTTHNRDKAVTAAAEPAPVPKREPESIAPVVTKPTPPVSDIEIVDEAVPLAKEPEKRAAVAEAVDEVPDAQSRDGESDDQATVGLAAGFSLEQLPITVENTWIIKGEGQSCSLNTLTLMLDDGQGVTPVSLSLSAGSWWLRTQSDIDTSYSDTGLSLDNGQHFELENVVKDTSIQFVTQRQALTDALQDASSMTVSLGFWPTWPVTQARSTQFSVQHFPAAYALWQICNQRISAP